MTADDQHVGPLDGIRVIDLSTIVLGPLAAQMLGDMGADVIKVESPEGDTARTAGPEPTRGRGTLFLGSNRNKRSLVLDLKAADGRAALLELAAGCDVFLHNMRPQAVERLGLGYAAVKAARSDIVYCAAYGFRAGGRYSHKPAFDDMIQAASGFAALQGRNLGRPAYATSIIADKICALATAQAVALALFHRARTGRGQAIEVPMFETLVAFNMVEHLYGRSFEPPRGPAGYPRALSPDRRPYRTADGYIGALPYTERQWRAFLDVAGRAELAADPRFASYSARLANVDALYAELAACLAERTSAEWLEALDAAHIPCTVVNDPDDLPDDPHLAEVGFWEMREDAELGMLRMPGIPTGFSDSPGTIRRLAPRLGEHSVEVLREAGLSAARIDRLLAEGVAVQAPPLAARADQADQEEVP
jgi:crotonobetainyl-CoA:carnitine CoA-transferase CaiB-like acyl-CoA transferase